MTHRWIQSLAPADRPDRIDAGGTIDKTALIIDTRAVMGTEACRSLFRQGYRVDIVGDSASPAFRCRYRNRAIVLSHEQSGEAYLRELDEIAATTHYDVILICNEQILEMLLPLVSLDRWRGLVIPNRQVVRRAISKSAMIEVARDAGVSVPETICPERLEDLPAIANRIGYPLVVKGDRGESGQRVRLARNWSELSNSFREIAWLEKSNGSLPSIQAYVNGTAYSVGGLFWEGQPLRVCAHRKLITVPPWTGLTVRGITERREGLLEEAFKIFKALGFSGLGHIEFIRDSRGQFRFIEVNPRVWGTSGVAALAEVDLFTPYAALARGEIPVPDLNFKEGVLFHRIGREVKMIRRQPGRTLGFLKDCLDPRVRSDFNWLDPAPHLTGFKALRLWPKGSSAGDTVPESRVPRVKRQHGL